jgi:hypothetical protein
MQNNDDDNFFEDMTKLLTLSQHMKPWMNLSMDHIQAEGQILTMMLERVIEEYSKTILQRILYMMRGFFSDTFTCIILFSSI